MALANYIERKFGIRTHAVENPVVAQIEVNSTMILRNNPDRLAFLVVNLGAFPIYMCFTGTPSITRGIFLQNNGGVLSMTADEDFELTGYEFNAIAIGGASEVYVLEIEAA